MNSGTSWPLCERSAHACDFEGRYTMYGLINISHVFVNILGWFGSCCG